jgi:hypothetical protein
MSDAPYDHPNEGQTEGLSELSALAVDEVFQSGFDAEAALSPAGARVRGFLGLLSRRDPSGPVLANSGEAPPLLVSLTMARVLRSAEQDLAGRIHPVGGPERLSRASAEEVDLVASGEWSAPGEQSRAASLLSLLATIEGSQKERERLVDATLAGVQRQIESSRSRFRLSPERSASAARSVFRIRDFVGAAAAVLLFSSVVWPMLSGSREQARESQCRANLSRAALGFSNYAADNRGQLPQARASFLGGTWWDVGRRDRSHSANLFVLARHGYASLTDLACPGNASAPTASSDASRDWRSAEEVSYSYQLFGPGRPRWDSGAPFVVLADKSPVVQRARLGEQFDRDECSRNHAGRGQNLLFGDGSLRFELRPTLSNGDNIWLPARIPAGDRPITGRETPEHDGDAFVGP